MYVATHTTRLHPNCQPARGMPGQPLADTPIPPWNPPTGTRQPRPTDAGRQVTTLRVSTVAADATETARTLLRLCFQPNGDVYTTSADAFDVANDTNAPLVTQRDRARFTIARTIDGVAYGVPRRVLFPTAGSMRFE
jgi:hypothetical protein